MNNNRRKILDKIIVKLEEIASDIESVCDEEQECYDNLPESFQYSERGEAMDVAIDYMQEAIDDLNEAADALREAMG